MSGPCDLGLIGLGVMGRALALNMSEHGVQVAGHDLSPDTSAQIAATAPAIEVCPTAVELLARLKRPRVVMLLLPAGSAVDEQLQALRPQLAPGDVVVDLGNSHFADTMRREQELGSEGLRLLGVGISGGEQGARHGPSIMAGGAPEAWLEVEELLTTVAASVQGLPCAAWLGPHGAGHFVKMVHNGIEYADMQLIAEIYLLLGALGLDDPAIATELEAWQQGELESYLLGITVDILRMDDPLSGAPVLQIIEDAAGQKGTGRWAAQSALELGVAAPTLQQAVAARALSASAGLRGALTGRMAPQSRDRARSGVLPAAKLEGALFAGRLAALAQGFDLLRAGSAEHGFGLRLAPIARLWRGGCILRARLLDELADACEQGLGEAGLLGHEALSARLEQSLPALRGAVQLAAEAAVPAPCLASALAWIDGAHRNQLGANLLQAQRDTFGAHGFARTDRPGRFHLDGSED